MPSSTPTSTPSPTPSPTLPPANIREKSGIDEGWVDGITGGDRGEEGVKGDKVCVVATANYGTGDGGRVSQTFGFSAGEGDKPRP